MENIETNGNQFKRPAQILVPGTAQRARGANAGGGQQVDRSADNIAVSEPRAQPVEQTERSRRDVRVSTELPLTVRGAARFLGVSPQTVYLL